MEKTLDVWRGFPLGRPNDYGGNHFGPQNRGILGPGQAGRFPHLVNAERFPNTANRRRKICDISVKSWKSSYLAKTKPPQKTPDAGDETKQMTRNRRTRKDKKRNRRKRENAETDARGKELSL